MQLLKLCYPNIPPPSYSFLILPALNAQCPNRKRRTCANEMQPAHRTELKAAVGAALGDGGLYPARLAMGGGAGYGTALEALRDGSGRCTRRGA